MECPLCKGCGEVDAFDTMEKQKKIAIAKTLRDNNLSIRDIMKVMGYKSPRSIQKLLE